MAHASDKPQNALWTETPEVREGPVARVAMVAAIEGEYSFAIPDSLAEQIEPGKRVLVPFGTSKRSSPAFCVSVAREQWTSTLKEVAEVIDAERLLSDSLLELGTWISRYYGCPLGRALSAMVPEAIRKRSGFRTIREYCLATELRQQFEQNALAKLNSAKRQKVVDVLAAHRDGLDADRLLAESGASKSILAAMVKASQIEMTTYREPAPAPDFDQPFDEPTFELNPAQQAAIERIGQITTDSQFRTVLLFGVSGSGKTEVYIRAIRDVLARGKQAIFLVPEIALTTQLVERLACRFHNVALVHSGLTGVQRSLTFSAIARGQKRVVIGTRSAVFAPCSDLGLIVVDEEQEASFKNQRSPRFHTRDVAIKRAQLAKVPILLGSATPSLETWYNSEKFTHCERIRLPSRICGLPMPAVEFVDMRFVQKQRRGLHLLSPQMERQVGETLQSGQQAILLLNRRGYASYLVCGRCRHPIVCPNCRVNMVFHQTTGKAMCHYCSARMIVPTRCADPSCAGKLIRWGMGTQRVEEEIRKKFPDASVARADSDTMKHVSEYEQLLHAFARRETDVLIGTQMIAKGLDFPDVAFVGIVNADTALSMPDFRAAERTFQMVTQVAGRAGRAGTQGRVVVQSLAGFTPALQYAAKHDYESFVRHELAIRHKFGWPPFSRLARVIVSNRSQTQARREVHDLVGRLRQYLADQNHLADVLGPQTAPLPRLRNMYRYDFLIRAANASRLMETLDKLRNEGILKPTTRHILLDVDPVSLL